MITNLNASGKRVKLEKNGKYRIFPTDFSTFSSISALWLNDNVNPAGTLSFSVDGDSGANSQFGTINLDQVGQSGSRTCASNINFAFIDVELKNLPALGKLMLFLR